MKLVVAVSSLVVVVTACTTSRSPAPSAPRPMSHEEAEAQRASQQQDAGEPGESEADEKHEQEMAGKTRDHVDADGVVRRGQPLSSMEATPVSVAIAKAAELEGKKVKLAGTVNNVCAKAGCWFALQGDKADDTIRISTRAKDIYVPHNAVGMKALVEGTLVKKNGALTVDVTGLEMHAS